MSEDSGSVARDVAQTLSRHAWGFDEGDWDLCASAYTADAVVVVIPDEDLSFTPVPQLRSVGRDAIIDGYRASHAEFVGRGERPWHVITNILVDAVDGDTAKVRSFITFLRSTTAGVRVFGIARYEDVMVVEGQRWRIKSRVNRIAYAHDDASSDARDS